MSRLDQLVYTSAEDGLDGRPGFQVIAATPRLAPQTTSLSSAALRLCRYERPTGVADPADAPVSYGWIDVGDTRLVFCRTYAGLDAWGRPGNFFAHIVAGPPDELPVYELVQRFESEFWWRGQSLEWLRDDSERYRLKAITLADIPERPMPSAPEDDALQLLEAAIAAGGRSQLAFCVEPARMMAALNAAVERLPEVFERSSLSTYEGTNTAGWFDLVGIGPSRLWPPDSILTDHHRGRGRRPGARRTARLVMSTNVDDRRIIVVAVEAATGVDRTLDIDLFVSIAEAVHEVTSGRPVEIEALLPALSKPIAAQSLLNLPAARTSVARAAVENPWSIWNALGGLETAVDPRVLAELGSAMGSYAAGRSATIDAVIKALEGTPHPVREACISAVLTAVAEDPSPLNHLEVGTRLTLLRHAASAPTPEAVIETLLSWASDDHCVLVDDADLPGHWRARVLAEILRATPSYGPAITRRLSQEPELVQPLVAQMKTSHSLVAVLRHVDPLQAAAVALQEANRLDGDGIYHLLTAILNRLPAEQQLPYLTRCATQAQAHPDPRWAWTAADVICPAVRVALSRIDVDPVPPAELIGLLNLCRPQTSEIPRPLAWARILGGLHQGGDLNEMSWELGSVLWSLASDNSQDIRAATELILAVRVRAGVDLTALEELVGWLFRYASADRATVVESVLRAGARNIRLGHDLESAAVCVEYLALRITRGELQIRRNGALKHSLPQEMASWIVLNLDPPLWRSHASTIGDMGGQARRWLATLAHRDQWRSGARHRGDLILPVVRGAVGRARERVSRVVSRQ
jgi:hypothetical protein